MRDHIQSPSMKYFVSNKILILVCKHIFNHFGIHILGCLKLSLKYLESELVLTGNLAPTLTDNSLGSIPHIFFVYGLRNISANLLPTLASNNSSVFLGIKFLFLTESIKSLTSFSFSNLFL